MLKVHLVSDKETIKIWDTKPFCKNPIIIDCQIIFLSIKLPKVQSTNIYPSRPGQMLTKQTSLLSGSSRGSMAPESVIIDTQTEKVRQAVSSYIHRIHTTDYRAPGGREVLLTRQIVPSVRHLCMT